MKAILIMHNAAIEEEVMEVLTAHEASCFTMFPSVLGRGELSDPHLNTEVWPETNGGMLVVVPPDKAACIMSGIRDLRQRLAREGVKAFMWEIEEQT